MRALWTLSACFAAFGALTASNGVLRARGIALPSPERPAAMPVGSERIADSPPPARARPISRHAPPDSKLRDRPPDDELATPEELEDHAVREESEQHGVPDDWEERAATKAPEDLAAPLLLALSRETFIHSKPHPKARRIGYLRTGARVRRAEAASGHDGCAGGWYRIVPEGYVCVGDSATLDLAHPVAQVLRGAANRDDPLPYRYGMTRGAPPVLYARIPQVPPSSRSAARGPWSDAVIDPLPELLARGEAVPTAFGYARSAESLIAGTTVRRSAFAFERLFEAGGHRYGLTPDLELVRLDRLEPVVASDFHGVALGQGADLPVAFVMAHGQALYSGDPRTGLASQRALAFREAVPVTAHTAIRGGVTYLQTQQGDWIADRSLIRVTPRRPPRGWESKRWIDVSLRDQTLTAYDGERPVFATLVSTGVDGGVRVKEDAGDPEDDPEDASNDRRATPIGQFLIHTKHVTTTMSGQEVGDEYDLRDVPYVQYFYRGFALHAAYWHDGFGRPKSHGCVNLSPRDARFLFNWTEPPVPRGWHGAMSRHGTPVDIHL